MADELLAEVYRYRDYHDDTPLGRMLARVAERLRASAAPPSDLAQRILDHLDAESSPRDPAQRLALVVNLLERASADAPKAGVMHPTDEAFYKHTIAQRDAAWREIEQLKADAGTPSKEALREAFECGWTDGVSSVDRYGDVTDTAEESSERWLHGDAARALLNAPAPGAPHVKLPETGLHLAGEPAPGAPGTRTPEPPAGMVATAVHVYDPAHECADYCRMCEFGAPTSPPPAPDAAARREP